MAKVIYNLSFGEIYNYTIKHPILANTVKWNKQTKQVSTLTDLHRLILCSASFNTFWYESIRFMDKEHINVRTVNTLQYTEPSQIPVNWLHFTCNSNNCLGGEMVKLFEEVSDVASEFEVQVQLNNALQF